VFTDPVHGAEASALAEEIARDGRKASARVEISAGALADACPQPPATR